MFRLSMIPLILLSSKVKRSIRESGIPFAFAFSISFLFAERIASRSESRAFATAERTLFFVAAFCKESSALPFLNFSQVYFKSIKSPDF